LEQAPEVERMTRHPTRGLLGARVTVPPDEGEGYWDLTRIRDDIYVVVANFTYKDPRVEIVPGDGLVQFNFKLSGDMSLAVSRTEPLRWNRPSLLVWAQPTGVDISEWTAPSTRERFIIISIRPEFLAEHFLTSSVDAPQQLQAFVTNKPEKIIYTQRPLTSQTFDVTTRLIDNPFSGPLGLVYTEALALELLCCAVQSFTAARTQVPAPGPKHAHETTGATAHHHQTGPLGGHGQVDPDQRVQGGVWGNHPGFQSELPHAPCLELDA
jgi:hypothetical protein